jgi:hypothetical protein
MFSASEIDTIVGHLGTSKPRQYSDAHQFYPTVVKLINLGRALKEGGVLMHLTELEAEAIAAARKAAIPPSPAGSQPAPGALEAST